jgi:hypothetical protein
MLLEKILAIFLATTLTALLLENLATPLRVTQELREKNSSLQNIIAMDGILREIIQHTDQHRLPLFPKFHPHGEIRFADGVVHPLSSRNDEHKPAQESDAITVLQIEPGKMLRLSAEGRICDSFSSPQHIIAYTGSGWYEAEVSRITDPPCSEVAIQTYARSIFFLQPEEENGSMKNLPKRPFLLLPIRSITTYYVSKGRTFRLAQHRGESITENQPVLENAPEMRLSSELDSYGRYHLSVSFALTPDREIQTGHTTLLQRRNLDVELLQYNRGRITSIPQGGTS